MRNSVTWNESQVKNEQFYDSVYATVNIDSILSKVKNKETFLDNAVRTYTSFAGFYHGNFKDQIEEKKVLELGCGDCVNAALMAALGAEVVANDISAQSGRIIEELNRQYPFKYPIKFIYGDFLLADLPDSSFDIVAGKNFVHHLTHEQELEFTKKIVSILKPDGIVRYFEPAENNKLLDNIRWIIPVPGRPSILQKRKFAEWKNKDPHPLRDNSYRSYLKIGSSFFNKTEIIPIGGIERFNRLLPQGSFNFRFRRLALAFEKLLPRKLNLVIARSQTIIYEGPIKAV
ncbi:class I SAM-dependent methyltransferase [Segetibacter sp.]|uniref:class I SAM-dependent methyltransferase n=1 Tax=Segetibacter sp. TaxID=2231182 RepID=UPI002634E475|nr:class I SAM-dependent methyltransferase [Segetibacter sp.]MCW3078781.1 class SAM-dependent methyltransferase [Segetibacter sp.]